MDGRHKADGADTESLTSIVQTVVFQRTASICGIANSNEMYKLYDSNLI